MRGLDCCRPRYAGCRLPGIMHYIYIVAYTAQRGQQQPPCPPCAHCFPERAFFLLTVKKLPRRCWGTGCCCCCCRYCRDARVYGHRLRPCTIISTPPPPGGSMVIRLRQCMIQSTPPLEARRKCFHVQVFVCVGWLLGCALHGRVVIPDAYNMYSSLRVLLRLFGPQQGIP